MTPDVTLGKRVTTDYYGRHDSVSLRCLNESIGVWCADTGQTRGDLAGMLGVSEPQFSRLTTGVQAFGLAHLDQLPRDLRVEFYRRLHESDDGADLATRLADRLAHAAIDFLSHAKKPMAKKEVVDKQEAKDAAHG